MDHVFVVRWFCGGNNDTRYIGAYSDFREAAKASIDDILFSEFADDKYGYRIIPMISGLSNDSIWIETTYKESPQELYYSIDKLRIQ
jgi:hypothetical protein